MHVYIHWSFPLFYCRPLNTVLLNHCFISEMSVYSVDEMSSVRQPSVRGSSVHGSVYTGSERDVRMPRKQGSIRADSERGVSLHSSIVPRHWGRTRDVPPDRLNYFTKRGERKTADRVAGRVVIKDYSVPIGGTQVTLKEETLEWNGMEEGRGDWHRRVTMPAYGKISRRDAQKKDWINYVYWH